MSPMLHFRLIHQPVAKTLLVWLAILAITGLLAVGFASREGVDSGPTPPIYLTR